MNKKIKRITYNENNKKIQKVKNKPIKKEYDIKLNLNNIDELLENINDNIKKIILNSSSTVTKSDFNLLLTNIENSISIFIEAQDEKFKNKIDLKSKYTTMESISKLLDIFMETQNTIYGNELKKEIIRGVDDMIIAFVKYFK